MSELRLAAPASAPRVALRPLSELRHEAPAAPPAAKRAALPAAKRAAPPAAKSAAPPAAKSAAPPAAKSAAPPAAKSAAPPVGPHIPVLDEPLPVVSEKALPAGPCREHAVSREELERYVELAGPHCAQVLGESARRHIARQDLALRPAESVPLFLTEASPAIPFADRPDDERSPLHWGQMKLYVSELLFLTEHAAGPATVVYAGAAPGHHIPYLAGLFPACTFLLYDPAKYCPALTGRPPANVTATRAFFTEELAAQLREKLQGSDYLFICDIRTGKEEKFVQADMDRQEAWIRILDPLASMVKFRLPWQPGTTTYPDGRILLGTYHPLTSTESRLIVPRGSAPRAYDNALYEQQCAYHNTVGRVFAYDHGVAAEGLDRCHDCAALVAAAKAYLRRAGKAHDPPAIGEFIAATCAAFGTGRTLASEYAPSSNRSKKQFPRRDFSGDRLTVERGGRRGPPQPRR